jgi:predicted DNA-binding transcriptional regulator YafY
MGRTEDILRQIKIASFVLENPNRFSEDDLANKFYISVATLRRDAKALRELGVKIHSRKRYFAIEHTSLSILNDLISNYIALSQNFKIKNLRLLRQKFNNKTLGIFITICRAIRKKHQLQFNYRDKSYTVSPLLLNKSQTTFHLIAYHLNVIKFFNLENISNISEIKKRNEFKDLPDIDAIYRNVWGYFTGGNEVDVKLKFSRDMGEYIEEKFWMENQKIEYIKDRIILTMRVKLSFEFLSWVIGWGGEVEIIEPKELMQEVIQKAKEIINKYKV